MEIYTTYRLSDVCDHCGKRGPVEVTYNVQGDEVTEESALCKNCQDK